jgi:hypothetical protein
LEGNKMELNQKQIETLKKQIMDGEDLKKVLNQFPNAEIAIIMGWDRFSYESYVKDAYFSKERAKEIMDKIPPNGTPDLSDIYHIIIIKTKELNQEKIKHGTDTLDEIHIKFVYEYLEKALKD